MSKGFHTVDLHACASAAIPTPAIGQNGNWYVGNDDTGVKAGTTSNLDQRLADLEAKYEQVNSDLAISHNQRVNMSTYNSSSDYYVCQSNGILTMYASGNTTSSIDLFYIDDTNTVIELYSKAGNNVRHDTLYFPIYKGFKIYVVKAGVSEVYFYPFVK